MCVLLSLAGCGSVIDWPGRDGLLPGGVGPIALERADDRDDREDDNDSVVAEAPVGGGAAAAPASEPEKSGPPEGYDDFSEARRDARMEAKAARAQADRFADMAAAEEEGSRARDRKESIAADLAEEADALQEKSDELQDAYEADREKYGF